MKDCPFCDTKDKVIKENDHAQVILSNPRKMPGHFLIMPKRHIEEPWELSHEEVTGIFDLIFTIEQKIIGELGDGCDIRQNYRPYAHDEKLKASHVVFHVYPRYKDDYLYKVSEQYEADLFTDLDDQEEQDIIKLLA